MIIPSNVNSRISSSLAHAVPPTQTDTFQIASECLQVHSVPTEQAHCPKSSQLTKAKHASLDRSQGLNLNGILKKTYSIPGKNGAPTIQLNLLQFLQGLYTLLPDVNILLIGSAAGYVIKPQSTGYNDLDFLIQMQMFVEDKEEITNYVKQEVERYFNQTRHAIEVSLAAQLENLAERPSLKSIGQNYFNTHVCINLPLNHSPPGNRCSIIRFGPIEFKATIDLQQNNGVVIPGLKNPSAFDRDDLRIRLTKDFLKFENTAVPLEVCSLDVPLKKAFDELKTKELFTSHCDGDKCIKGNDYITFKGCFYPDEEINRSIYTQFLENPTLIKKLENYHKKHEENPSLGTICALSNFCINGTNLKIDAQRIQPFYERIDALLPHYFPSLCKKIPETLLLKWCSLTLFLSAVPASHTAHLLTLNFDTEWDAKASLGLSHSTKPIYYLLKLHCPLTLLFECVQLLQQHPEISLEDLPAFAIKFKTTEQLFLKVKSSLEGEQLIPFYHFLLVHFPSHLKHKEDLNFEMLQQLFHCLANTPSVQKRQELIQLTQSFVEKRDLVIPKLFSHLTEMVAPFPPISSLFLLCIQNLASSSTPKRALDLWEYAKKQSVFTASVKDEIQAFICVQEIQLKDNPSKDALISLLNETINIIKYNFNKLASEDIKHVDDFYNSLLSIVCKLSHTNCTANELQMLIYTYKIIAQSDYNYINIRNEVSNKIFDVIGLLSDNKQSVTINAIQDALKTYSEEPSKDATKKVISCLRSSPHGLTLAKGLFNIPFFTTTLIEEMKNGVLEDNIAWFTLLHNNNLLKNDDEKSWECCGTLLTQWKQSPSLHLYKQILPALQFLKNSLKQRKESAQLKLNEQTTNAYTNFVTGCINSPEQQLVQEAEAILCSEIKSILPLMNATLFSHLIAHAKTRDAEILLAKALSQKILTKKSPQPLVNSHYFLLKRLLSENSEKIRIFTESSINNSTLIEVLIGPEILKGNKLMLQLISNSQHVKSPNAIDNLLLLFKQLYKNRKTNADSSLDTSIRDCTYVLFSNNNLSNHFNLQQWRTLADVLIDDKILFNGRKQSSQNLLAPTLSKVSLMAFQFIKNNCMKNGGVSKCSQLLNPLKKYGEIKITSEHADKFNYYFARSLIYLKSIENAQAKFKEIADPNLRISAIFYAIDDFTASGQQKLLHSQKTQPLFEMLGKYGQEPLVMKGDSLDVFIRCILKWLKSSTHSKTLKNSQDRLKKLLASLENIVKTHPNTFKKIDGPLRELLITISIHNDFYLFASSLLNCAIENKIILEQDFIKQIEANMLISENNKHSSRKLLIINQDMIDINGNSVKLYEVLNNKIVKDPVEKDDQSVIKVATPPDCILSKLVNGQKDFIYSEPEKIGLFIEALKNYNKIKKISGAFCLDSYYKCIIIFMENTLNGGIPDAIRIQIQSLLNDLEGLLKDHRSELKNENRYYVDLLMVLSLNRDFYKSSQTILAYAVQHKIITEKKVIDQIQSNVRQTTAQK